MVFSIPQPYPDHDYCLSSVQLVANDLEAENRSLGAQVKLLSDNAVSVASLRSNAGKFKHFSGLPNFQVFSSLVKYLSHKARRLWWWLGNVTVENICTPGSCK